MSVARRYETFRMIAAVSGLYQGCTRAVDRPFRALLFQFLQAYVCAYDGVSSRRHARLTRSQQCNTHANVCTATGLERTPERVEAGIKRSAYAAVRDRLQAMYTPFSHATCILARYASINGWASLGTQASLLLLLLLLLPPTYDLFGTMLAPTAAICAGYCWHGPLCRCSSRKPCDTMQ